MRGGHRSGCRLWRILCLTLAIGCVSWFRSGDLLVRMLPRPGWVVSLDGSRVCDDGGCWRDCVRLWCFAFGVPYSLDGAVFVMMEVCGTVACGLGCFGFGGWSCWLRACAWCSAVRRLPTGGLRLCCGCGGGWAGSASCCMALGEPFFVSVFVLVVVFVVGCTRGCLCLAVFRFGSHGVGCWFLGHRFAAEVLVRALPLTCGRARVRAALMGPCLTLVLSAARRARSNS